MSEPDRYRCCRCGMTFRVQDPMEYAEAAQTVPLTDWCGELCGIRFWHIGSGHGGPVIVGVWPDPRERAAQEFREALNA